MNYTQLSGLASQSGGSVVLSRSSSSSPPPQPASAAMSSMPSSVRNMLQVCVPAVALAIAPAGEAQAQWHDNWKGKDKREHFKGSAAMAGAGALVTDSNGWVFGGCMAVGVGWELRNRRLVGQPVSWKDLVADAGGCGFGLGVTRGASLLVQQIEGRTVVSIRLEN